MSLEETNKGLYDPDSQLEKRRHEQNPFDPRVVNTDGQSFQVEETWLNEKEALSAKRRKIIKVGILAVAGAVFAFSLYFFVPRLVQSAFSEDRVSVSIEGPEAIDSNQSASFLIKYENNNRASLKNAVLSFNYAPNFQPEQSDKLEILNQGNSRISLGDINSYDSGQLEIKGKFYAPRDHVVYIKVILEYTPSNFNSTFRTENQIGVNIQKAPISLELNAPAEAADGNQIEYAIIYKNLSSRPIVDAGIRVQYPQGFQFSSAEPAPNENSFWYLGNLAAGQEGRIDIKGTIKGKLNEGKIIQVSAGSSENGGQFVTYTENEKLTRMIASPFFISQEVVGAKNGSVDIGQSLDFSIIYRNESNVGLRNAIATFEFKSPILDYTSLELERGYYDSSKNTITWKAVDYPQLANMPPGAGGTIKFKISVLKKIPVATAADKNFTITTVAKIDSPDVPFAAGTNKIIASNVLNLKLKTKLFLETTAAYKDQNIENTGPNPPQVGEATSYAVHWKILNVCNDASDVKVVSSLPTGVEWTGKIFPENESLSFNERTNQLVWNVGKVNAGTGIITSKREVSFQVSLIPQINQQKSTLKILDKSVLTGSDIFTETQLSSENEPLSASSAKE